VPRVLEADGEQCVAVTAGSGLDAQGVQDRVDTIRGTKSAVPKPAPSSISSFGEHKPK
jgi:hypothetical protein